MATEYLTQAQLQAMMDQRFGVPEETVTSSPLSFQYQNEEYPNSYGKSQLYYDRTGPFSDRRQTQDQDAYYDQVRTIGTAGDPFMGARDRVDAPFAKQSGDYYAGNYVNYDEPFQRPGTEEWEMGLDPIGSQYDQPYEERESDPMLMQALINQNQSNLYGPLYNRAPLNQQDLKGIKAAKVPFQDFSFSEYQGPSQEEEGDYPEEKAPWYRGIINEIGSPFKFIGDKLKASKYYKGAPAWTPAYNQAGMPIQGYGYTAADLNKMNALGGYYSEPARAHRRAKNRIENLLQRRAQGKTYSAKNLKELSGGQFDFGAGKQGSYQAPTRSAPPGMSAPSSGMHGGKHYSRGGIVSLI